MPLSPGQIEKLNIADSMCSDADREKFRADFDQELVKSEKEAGTELTGKYRNEIQGWWFSKEEIEEAQANGKMLTLDLDVGRFCHLNCPECFACTRSEMTEKFGGEYTEDQWQQIQGHVQKESHNSEYINNSAERLKAILDEAAMLGVKSIKIVGAGEPLLYPKLFEVLERAQCLGIVPVIFTAGDVLGSDKRVEEQFGAQGIHSAIEMAGKLKDLGCSIVVKFRSFNPALANAYVGNKPETKSYVESRNYAVLNLAKLGFNSGDVTQLGVDCLLGKHNVKEALELFKFFNKHNIFCVVNTAMDCGATTFDSELMLKDPAYIDPDTSTEVAASIQQYIEDEGINFDGDPSPYMGSPVCSQLTHGFFVGDNGEIKMCPGSKPLITRYEKPGDLAKAWQEQIEWLKTHPEFNQIGHKCISRFGRTYPDDLVAAVKEKMSQTKAKTEAVAGDRIVEDKKE